MTWKKRQYGGFWWSPWSRLGDVSHDDVPGGIGIYRIRSRQPERLAYVGEGVLRSRIGHWRRACSIPEEQASAVSDDRLEFLAFHEERLGGYEVSWTQGPADISDKRIRRGHESHLLWLYRREACRSALANCGRAHSKLNLIGSGKLAYGKTFFLPSSRPVEPCGHQPHSDRWMGFRWTQLISRRELKHASKEDLCGFRLGWMQHGPALYKALSPRLKLLKIGYKRHAQGGLLDVFRSLPGGTVAAWANVGPLIPKYHCLELCTDLVGAHFHRTGEVPGCQF